jgi:hypothetical protein
MITKVKRIRKNIKLVERLEILKIFLLLLNQNKKLV